MGTVSMTPETGMSRTLVLDFSSTFPVPVDVRHAAVEALREATPPEISTEHLGYAVSAVVGVLVGMDVLAVAAGEQPGRYIQPTVLAVLASAAEECITEDDLSAVL